MKITGTALLSAAALCLALAAPASAQALKSPDQVKTSLRQLSQATSDFSKQIAREVYAGLPNQNAEFRKATAALRQAIAGEPQDFKNKLNPALQKATDTAQKIATDSAGKDDTKLRTDQAVLAQAVNAVIVQFPVNLRPTAAGAAPAGGWGH
jgi:gas vesicle protein